ncbi:MAG: DUF5692 family protein, partial [Cyanobacteria bacterium J06576_12]
MTLTMILITVVYFLIACIASEIMRRLPPQWGLAFWLVVPLVLLPHFLNVSASQETWTWFLWAKLYSISASVVWIMICRIASVKIPKQAIQLPLFFALGLNILEAVAVDILSGYFFNAIAGILLILTMGPANRFSIDNNRWRDFLYNPGKAWIIAYTIWNFVFIYYSFKGTVAIQHIALLAAPLVMAVVTGWKRYLQSRAFILGIHFMAYASAFGWYRDHFTLPPEAYVPNLQWAVQCIS